MHKLRVSDSYMIDANTLSVFFGISPDNMKFGAVIAAFNADGENYSDDCFEIHCLLSNEGFTMSNPYYVLENGGQIEFKKQFCNIDESEFQNATQKEYRNYMLRNS